MTTRPPPRAAYVTRQNDRVVTLTAYSEGIVLLRKVLPFVLHPVNQASPTPTLQAASAILERQGLAQLTPWTRAPSGMFDFRTEFEFEEQSS